MDLELERPNHIGEVEWEAISAYHERLLRAGDARDRPQSIGSLKDLMECIAKAVVTMRGEVVEPALDFQSLITRAHRALERQPGEGLSATPPLRSVSQGAKSIAINVASLRNAFGTGHGRAYEPEINDELFNVGLEAGMLWCRWALRRLGALAFGLPEALIRDLGTAWFLRGEVAARLDAANLRALPETEQRRVGIAVGRRSMRETFLVRQEGVAACANSTDLQRWPSAYRVGVLWGLFFDAHEELTIDRWMADVVPLIVAPVAELNSQLKDLRDTISRIPAPLTNVDFARPYEIQALLRSGEDLLPADSRRL